MASDGRLTSKRCDPRKGGTANNSAPIQALCTLDRKLDRLLNAHCLQASLAKFDNEPQRGSHLDS